MREWTPGASAARRQDHDNPVESRRLSNPRAPRLIETPEELRAEAVDLAVAHRVDALATGVDAVEAYRADFFERTPLAAALEAVLGRDVRDLPAWVHGATAPSPRLSLIGYRLGDAAGGPSYVDGRDGKRAVDRRVFQHRAPALAAAVDGQVVVPTVYTVRTSDQDPATRA